MSKVICMASAKGGVGKTVLTAAFSAQLAALGKRVLAVDIDAATIGLTFLCIDDVNAVAPSDQNTHYGLFELGHRSGDGDSPTPTRRKPHIVKSKAGFFLLPAAYDVKSTEYVDVGSYKESLQEILPELRSEYQYIFLDAQAGSDSFARAGWRREISDLVVIVSEADSLSANGVHRLLGLFPDDLSYSRTRVLLNRVLPEYIGSRDKAPIVGRHLSPIPWSANVVHSYSDESIALGDQECIDFSLATMRTLRSLLGGEIGADLDKYITSRAIRSRDALKEDELAARSELPKKLSSPSGINVLWSVMIAAVAGVSVFLGAVTLGAGSLLNYLATMFGALALVVFVMLSRGILYNQVAKVDGLEDTIRDLRAVIESSDEDAIRARPVRPENPDSLD